MDLIFEQNGDITGYKTDFMKELLPELKNDTNVVKIFNPTPETSVAICYDETGHLCSLCKKSSNKFAEFEMDGMKRICLKCTTNIFELLFTL